MKAKTKRRVLHVLTKKKLVKKHTSRHVLRTFLIGLATLSMGSLAYGITLNQPTASINVNSSGPTGIEFKAPTPTPAPQAAAKPRIFGPGSGSGTVGKASWYALGLPQPDALTCASRTYPRGSHLHVTNLRNHRTVVCRVNDYGPEAWTNRIIDLSRGSFVQIDSLSAGVAPVELRVAAGPSGSLPVEDDIASALIGYKLCHSQHSAQYCEAHRQD